MKFAIVDLGSNTIRLSVYNTLPEGGFDLLFSEKEMAGLVSYVHGGVLSPEGIQRACGAIRDFQALLRQFDLDAPHVFATASLRNIRTTEEALKAVPDSYRTGSLALGATKLQTIWRVVLPTAFPNITTGLILSIGRVSGETASSGSTARWCSSCTAAAPSRGTASTTR